MQRLYKRDRKRCAEKILDGKWNKPDTVTLSLDQQRGYWEPLFSSPSLADPRPCIPVRDTDWGLATPVTPEEVTSAINSSSETSPGPDKVTLGDRTYTCEIQ